MGSDIDGKVMVPQNIATIVDDDLTTMMVGSAVLSGDHMAAWFSTYKGKTMEKINQYIYNRVDF